MAAVDEDCMSVPNLLPIPYWFTVTLRCKFHLIAQEAKFNLLRKSIARAVHEFSCPLKTQSHANRPALFDDEDNFHFQGEVLSLDFC